MSGQAGEPQVGQPRAIGTDPGLAVYRAAQEALTNARKHAPGAEVSVRLDFTPKITVLVVDNGATGTAAASELAEGGRPGSSHPAEDLGALGSHPGSTRSKARSPKEHWQSGSAPRRLSIATRHTTRSGPWRPGSTTRR